MICFNCSLCLICPDGTTRCSLTMLDAKGCAKPKEGKPKIVEPVIANPEKVKKVKK